MSAAFQNHVFVCTQAKPDGAPCCEAVGGKAVLEALRAEIGKRGMAQDVLVTSCGCLGVCERGPNVVIYPEGKWFTAVTGTDVERIVREYLKEHRPVADREDPDPETVREEIAAHREKVKKMLAARERAGVIPDDLNGLLRGFQASRVILTAIELDLFTAVAPGTSSETVAKRVETDPRATEMLLNALVSLRLLEKAGDRFTNGDWARTFLCAGAPHDSRAAILHTAHLWPRWSTLTDCVKQGTSVTYEEMSARGDEWTEAFIAAMHRNAAFRAPMVVNALSLEGVKRILDLGGGSGAYAIAFAGAKPDLRVIVFDLPTVTPLTRRYASLSGVADRVETVDGDLRTDDYGSDFDLVFVSAICHMNGPDENLEMLRKVSAALRSGGRVVIQDFILNEEKTGPPFAALFALNMLVGTRNGNAYSESEYAGWMREVGFVGVEKIPLPGPSDLMVGTKP